MDDFKFVELIFKFNNILDEVEKEMFRQIELWGEQSHSDGTDEHNSFLADTAREICEKRFAAGQGTWLDILREEFFEAAAEIDPIKLRKELIQIMAVCGSWIKDINARTLD